MNKGMPTEDLEGLYQSVFRHSFVSLWLQDISELRRIAAQWRSRGVVDVQAYLESNPQEFRRALSSIEVVDVNDATLTMYEVRDKSELIGPLDRTLDLDDPQMVENLIKEITAIIDGKAYSERESWAITPAGKRLEVEIKIYIPPESSPYPYMLVNVIDITERKRLERKLEADRLLYGSLIGNLPDACYLKDRGGRYVIANGAMAEMAGVDNPERMVGRTDEDFFPDTAAASFADEDAEVLRTGDRVETEHEESDSTGGTRWWLSTKAPIRDQEGRITGIVGVSRDITALRRAQKAVQESERRYRTIFTDAPVGIFQSTTDGRLRDANPTFARNLGYDSPDELIEAVDRIGIQTLYAEEGHRPWVTTKALESHEWQRVQGPFRRKNGEIGFGRMMLRSFFPEGNSAAVLEGFMEDITDQEETRSALAWERSMLRALIDNTPDRIYFKDREGRFTLANNALVRSFGADSLEAVVGKSNIDYFSDDFSKETYEDELRIIRTGEPMVDKEESERAADGTIIWFSTTKMALRDESGSIIGTFGITRDITHKKLLEIQRIRAQRLESLGQLASGIAHHFNNINGAIMGYLSMVAAAENLPQKVRHYIDEALDGAKRVVEITARLEILTGAARSPIDRLQIESVLQSILPGVEEEASRESVTISTSWGETSPIRCSRASVEFVLETIMTNALHSLLDRPTRTIAIRTLDADGYACVEVADSGCGMTQEHSAKVFTPFFTTKGEWAEPDSPQARVKGTGLGLAVSRSLVTEQGGRIEIESRAGSGTTVRVFFPNER